MQFHPSLSSAHPHHRLWRLHHQAVPFFIQCSIEFYLFKYILFFSPRTIPPLPAHPHHRFGGLYHQATVFYTILLYRKCIYFLKLKQIFFLPQCNSTPPCQSSSRVQRTVPSSCGTPTPTVSRTPSTMALIACGASPLSEEAMPSALDMMRALLWSRWTNN